MREHLIQCADATPSECTETASQPLRAAATSSSQNHIRRATVLSHKQLPGAPHAQVQFGQNLTPMRVEVHPFTVSLVAQSLHGELKGELKAIGCTLMVPNANHPQLCT